MFKKVSETLGQRKQNRFLYYKVCRILHMLICIMSLPGIKCSFSKKIFFFIASFHVFVHESKKLLTECLLYFLFSSAYILIWPRDRSRARNYVKCWVMVPCTILDTRGWCTGLTQRDGMGREEGGGFRMGSTSIPVADSFWCWAKLIQYCKV